MPWNGLTLVHYVECITQLTLRGLPGTSPNIMGRVATEDNLASKLPLNSRSHFQGEKTIHGLQVRNSRNDHMLDNRPNIDSN
jgi:hypothetical protein